MITSTRNPGVMEHARLHDPRVRRRLRQTLVEGPHQVSDTISAGARVVGLYIAEGDPAGVDIGASWDGEPVIVGDAVLAKLAGTRHPRGPVAVVDVPDPAPLDPATDLVVLWEVSDPGNAGAIVRSAVAFGYAVAVTPGTVDMWSPRVVRSASATQFRTNVNDLGDQPLVALRSSGHRLVATVSDGGDTPERTSPAPIAVLIGNEAHGLGSDVSAAADDLVTVPLGGGVESLNAAVATGIVLHAMRRT